MENARRVCGPCLARVEKIPAPICVICGAPMQSAIATETRCSLCLDHPPHFATARAVARYRPSAESDRRSLPSLIRRHKYGLDQSLQKALAEFLGDNLPYSSDDCDVVIPVPLHHRRLWWRGFNQAALLAAPVARALDARFAPSALVRTRDTTAQATLPRVHRLRNVQSAFVARTLLEGARVLLVDDVRTTGATLEACASALRGAGALDVRSLVLACAE